MKYFHRLLSLLFLFVVCSLHAQNALVLQSDFSLRDGAVSAMKGVAYGVEPKIAIFDLTHEIPAYDVWQAAYRLYQTAKYWPAETVFVSVVDPGVGTERRSIVLKSKLGHYFVTPDNGTLTLIAQYDGVDSVRQIDETNNRLPGSEQSYTFHGRDVYAYTGARLAAGKITFEQVGPELSSDIVKIPYQQAVLEQGTIKGNIPILDIQYGNVWTNIHSTLFQDAGVKIGDILCIKIFEKQQLRYMGKAPYQTSFGEVAHGQPVIYLNSLLNVALALNMASFSETYHVLAGENWTIELSSCPL